MSKSFGGLYFTLIKPIIEFPVFRYFKARGSFSGSSGELLSRTAPDNEFEKRLRFPEESIQFVDEGDVTEVSSVENHKEVQIDKCEIDSDDEESEFEEH